MDIGNVNKLNDETVLEITHKIGNSNCNLHYLEFQFRPQRITNILGTYIAGSETLFCTIINLEIAL